MKEGMKPHQRVLETFALGREPFKTFDPFLFCVHHLDKYPAGVDSLGPHPSTLTSRNIGMDFSNRDGWSMYHGSTVPGFPEHPHRGFETITVVQQGFVDHSDSIKCTARYGNGDTQWMTAGKGIQHAEMFPLLQKDNPNPLSLFQIWLNLPKASKMCDPFFSMFWDEATPRAGFDGEREDGTSASPSSLGKAVATARVVAGELNGVRPLAPPPNSWAADESNDVAVWIVDIPAGATVTLPPAKGGKATTRALYFVSGKKLSIDGGEATVDVRTGARVVSDVPLKLQSLEAPASVLVLQGKPINEPVVKHGPFVMNSREEILQCFDDFRRTQFGGWPWSKSDHCHPQDTPRHAIHPSGEKEFPPNK